MHCTIPALASSQRVPPTRWRQSLLPSLAPGFPPAGYNKPPIPRTLVQAQAYAAQTNHISGHLSTHFQLPNSVLRYTAVIKSQLLHTLQHTTHITYTFTMPTRQDLEISIPNSPPPPVDITSYAKFMHEHTKKLLEATSPTAPRSSARSQSSMSSQSSNGIAAA